MTNTMQTFALAVVAAAILLIATYAQAQIVSEGDKVAMNYSCYLPDKSLLHTTLKTVHYDNSIPKASAYLGPQEGFPKTEVFAGSGYGGPDFDGIPFLSSEMAAQISKKLPGMMTGESRTVTIVADEVPSESKEDRFLEYSRKTSIKRLRTVPVPDEHADKVKIGQKFDAGEGLIGKVILVKDGNVTTQLVLAGDSAVQTSFGPARLEVVNDEYITRTLLAQKGDMLLFGMVIATVVEADESTLNLDYGQPFGGRTLTCNVKVESILETLGSQ